MAKLRGNKIGITKQFDGLGRISIPKEMRKMFKIENEVEIVIIEEGVLLRNPQYVLVKREYSE